MMGRVGNDATNRAHRRGEYHVPPSRVPISALHVPMPSRPHRRFLAGVPGLHRHPLLTSPAAIADNIADNIAVSPQPRQIFARVISDVTPDYRRVPPVSARAVTSHASAALPHKGWRLPWPAPRGPLDAGRR